MSRTPLTVVTAVTLACNLGKVVPKLGLSEEDAGYWNGHLDELHSKVQNVLSCSNWIDRIIQSENDAHRAFFGQTFDLAQFVKVLKCYGEDRIGQWINLGLEPHFLPKWQFRPDSKVRGWKVKPESWFWQKAADGSIKRRNAAGKLEVVEKVDFDGIAVLIDTRCKPAYDNGRQMFANDEAFMGSMIESLRTEGKIARYSECPQSSRFCISSKECDEQICPALTMRPEFEGVRWRLELAIEANSIPQIYRRMPRRKDGQTDTYVWYEEFFEDASSRLYGGYSVSGGLAHVDCHDVDNHWYSGAVRPVGVLVTRPVGV